MMGGMSNEFWYRLFHGVVRLLMRTVCRMHVEGIEHLSHPAPYLVAGNHLTQWDPPTLMSLIPTTHRLTGIAADKWRKVLPFRLLFDRINVIWVKRGEVDRVALSAVLAALKRGWVVGLTPEGTRSKTGGLQQARNGVAWIAAKAKVPVIPVAVWGVENIEPSLKRLHRTDVQVRIGPAITLDPADSHDASTERIMHAIAAMLPEKYRGVYG